MKAQRTIPPSAAPIGWRDLTLSLVSLMRPQATIRQREAEFREYFGVKHVWFVSSGKAALTLILKALYGLSGRRKVVVPGYTCFSVPSAVLKAQLEVMLCDVESISFDFDFDHLTRMADSEVLCVLATHLLGIGVDVPRIVTLCRQRGIFVVEDVAQAFGGDCEGKAFGTMGDAAFLSFGRGKNISCGSGGAILTNNDRIGDAIARYYTELHEESMLGMLQNWLEVAATQLLINPRFYWIPAGLPWLKLGETRFYKDFPVMRMDSLRAGLLRGWKARLDQATAIRVAHAEQALQSVSGSSVQTIRPSQRGRSVYLRLPLLMPSKEEKEALCRLSADQGLGLSSMYPSAIQKILELRDTLSSQHAPQSAMIAERLVTLPTHEFLSSSDCERIGQAIETVQQVEGRATACSSVGQEERQTISELPRVN